MTKSLKKQAAQMTSPASAPRMMLRMVMGRLSLQQRRGVLARTIG